MKWILEGLKNILESFTQKIAEILGSGVNAGLDQFHDLFVLIALIGVYLIFAGNKKLGTKFTSGSILSYIILKAVFKC